jgi:carotenoid cleavage dioxygenase
MVHDFALTERFAVLMNHPYTFDVRRWLRGEPIARFEPERGSFIGLLPRRASGSEVRWFPVAPCFVYHVVNAWDDGEQVVLDVFHRWALDLAGDLEPRPAPEELSQLWRWRIDPRGNGTVREDPLDETHADLPSTHPARAGRRARFAFASRLRSDVRQPLADALLKYDLQKPASPALHPFGPNRLGGEGLFVPRPGASDEDDGWLLAFVHDEAEGQSELLVVDARELAAPPLARVQLPQRVPFGSHGLFSPTVRG